MMHDRPSGKIRLYTRFFDFANLRFPLSTFLADVLRDFRVNISQLFVIGAAKVSHFEISCRVYKIIPTVGLFRCFYVNSKKSGWMSFSKHSDNASDPAPLAVDFNAQDYATLVAHLFSFRKFSKAFLCLVGLSCHYTLDEETYPWFLHKNGKEMDIFAFIHTPDPTKVRGVEHEQNKGEPRLLDTTIGRTVSLLPVSLDRAGSELEVSVDRLFDEGGSDNQAEQEDSSGGEQDANIQPVVEAVSTVVKNVAPVQMRHQGKRKSMIVDVGKVSHPSKNLREDHGTSSRASIGDRTDSVAELNLRTIEAPRRFVIYSDSSYHYATNVAEADVDSLVKYSIPIMTTVTTITLNVDPTSVTKENLVEPSSFGAGSFSAGGTEPTTGVFSDLTASVREMEHDQLFTEFNVGAARQISLSVKVRMRAGYNFKENGRLKSVVEREAKAAEAIRLRAEAFNFKAVEKSLRDETNALREPARKERELTGLNALITFVKSQNESLVDRVHELEISSFGLQEKVRVYQNCMEQLMKFQDDQMKVVNDKFNKLYTDFMEMDLHLEEKFYPHLLTTIFSRRWLFTQGIEHAIIKCLNSPVYLSALGAAIGKAIEKGVQDRLSAGITHGKEGRVLTDVAAHNPSAKVDYISALQQLQNVNFPLLAELKSHKDDSIKTVMDILRLDEPLVEKLGLDELQPNVDHLMVPIHHSPEKAVIGATALSLALDVSIEPFSTMALTCTKYTSDATADATMALSTTFASASTIAPISVDDYDVIGVDDQEVADGDTASFPNVDDAELNIPH
nr:hypothetical protein [Tanacetum cinerariifolium]